MSSHIGAAEIVLSVFSNKEAAIEAVDYIADLAPAPDACTWTEVNSGSEEIRRYESGEGEHLTLREQEVCDGVQEMTAW